MASRTDVQPQMARDILEIPVEAMVRQTRRNQEVQPQFLPLPPTKSASTQTDLPWYPSTTVTMSSNLKNDRPAQDISPIYASATPITMAVSSEPQQTEQSTWDPPFFPTVQEMNDWDDVKLHQWIDKRNPRLLQGNNLRKFQDAGIDGMGLLSMTREEFKQCGLSVPASAILMHLANQVRNSKTIPFG